MYRKILSFILFILAFTVPAQSAQQTLNNGDTFGTQRSKINSNFSEIYSGATAPVTTVNTGTGDVLVSLESVRAVLNELLGDIDFNGNSIVDLDTLGFNSGPDVVWNATEYTLDIPTGLGPVLQVGQELYVIVYNDTGDQINDGVVVYPTGQFGGFPTIDKAIADTHETLTRPIYLTTMNIPNGEYGIVSSFGYVRNLNTESFTLGQEIYLSPTVAGGLTSTKPEFPDYPVRIGGITKSGATDGEIFVNVEGKPHNTFENFFNGIFRESFDFTVSESGGIVTGSLSPSNGHPDMTMMFSDGFTMLTTTPPATIVLTPGTDSNPQTNYVYVPETTKVLTVSTSGWPVTEHIRVANIVLRSATTTGIDGALKNQNWNDHVESTDNFQGHMTHLAAAIREKVGATWKAGVAGSVAISTVPTPDDVFVATTGGTVMQMHDQTFPSFDLATGDDIHVVNDSVAAYKTITNLNGEVLDSAGVSLANRSFSFVVWGIANKAGEASHLMLNLPTNSYLASANAIEDADNYSVYSIPAQFQGVGFLIARLTFTLNAAGNSWVLEDNEDLRGFVPNTAAGGGGGGGGGGGATTFLGLGDTPSAYLDQGGKAVAVNVGETALEFVTIPLGHEIVSVSDTDSLTDEREHSFSGGAPATFTLPDGNYCSLYNINGGAMTIDLFAPGTQTFVRENGTSFTLGASIITAGIAGEFLIFQKFGTEWRIRGENASVSEVP